MAKTRVRVTHDEVGPLPEGLQRKANGRYYLRYRIPKDLVPRLGWAEISWALGTSDPKEARRVLPQQVANLLNEFDAVRTGANPAALPLLSRKRAVVRDGDAIAPKRPYPTISDAEFAYILDRQAYDEEEIADDLRRQYEEEELEDRVAEIVTQSRDSMSDADKMVLMLFREREEYKRLSTDQDHALKRSNLFANSVVQVEAVSIKAPAVEPTPVTTTSFDRLVDRWANERGPDAKGIDAHRAVARWFVERTGVSQVEMAAKKHVLLFKDKLLEEGQSLANIKTKISRLKTLLNWAVQNDIIQINPANDVIVVIPDADRAKRMTYDHASLRLLFDSPVYQADDRPAEGRGEAAYWLPLLALFTGARLEELGQLRPIDVSLERYPDANDVDQAAWFIRMVHNPSAGLKLKNAASERAVPVHSALERLGFTRFALDAQSSGQDRLFPELRPNKYGTKSAKWGEWFGSYLRDVVGLTDRRLVFHSFRHTFKDNGRGRMAEGVQRRIMGHANRDVAESYGLGYPMWQLVEAMGQYRVPGVVLPPSPPKYRAGQP
ncbi:site-specific integrase [Caulobacter sp.]|uniref:site-specific integrase n=1 Tax=Caulobacter sp. TaxID=78 RepID=UPI0031DFDF82